jgi:hypothetical protein
MPSNRKQLNVRADEETEKRVERLLPLVSKALGLRVSRSDLFRLGMIELERKFGGEAGAAPPGHEPVAGNTGEETHTPAPAKKSRKKGEGG